jgi:hypothetical protein
MVWEWVKGCRYRNQCLKFGVLDSGLRVQVTFYFSRFIV